jgi:hypothetical protein
MQAQPYVLSECAFDDRRLSVGQSQGPRFVFPGPSGRALSYANHYFRDITTGRLNEVSEHTDGSWVCPCY